jgi:1-pyrroline-5-carboxylate dehydrogenase
VIPVTTPTPKVKVTYTTLSLANEDLHTAYEHAVGNCKATAGQEYPNYIAGRPVFAEEVISVPSPVDNGLILSRFPQAGGAAVDEAVAAAGRPTRCGKRCLGGNASPCCGKAASLVEDRLFEIAAVISLGGWQKPA